jgi:two-component system response regulator RpaA
MLNRDPVTQAIPIVIISALGGYTDIRRAYNLGVIGYLTKPFDLEQVKKEIQRALSFKEKE